jgi:hypothetical protein
LRERERESEREREREREMITFNLGREERETIPLKKTLSTKRFTKKIRSDLTLSS